MRIDHHTARRVLPFTVLYQSKTPAGGCRNKNLDRKHEIKVEDLGYETTRSSSQYMHPAFKLTINLTLETMHIPRCETTTWSSSHYYMHAAGSSRCIISLSASFFLCWMSVPKLFWFSSESMRESRFKTSSTTITATSGFFSLWGCLFIVIKK